jgi:hypothetical protein
VRSTDNGSSFDNETSGTSLDMYGVTYGNNTFVAVGKIGNIRTSSDGSSWTHRTKPQNYNLMGVTFGNNTFVAVGYNGSVVRSTDNGTSWDDRTSASGITTQIQDVGFGNNTFVAVGSNGNIVRSTDNGSSFDNVTSGTSQSLRGVAFSGNWQLIARQADITEQSFNSNARNTYLEHEDNSSSSTFMSIGNLTPSNYVSAGKYKFKLVWGGEPVDPSCSVYCTVEDLSIKQIIWTQTTWLTDTTVLGLQEIEEGTSGFVEGFRGFDGLLKSTSSSCIIDGNQSDFWYHCVGQTRSPWNGGIPGPMAKIATSMHLYIWVP